MVAHLGASEHKLGYHAGSGTAEVDNSVDETGHELEVALYKLVSETLHIQVAGCGVRLRV